MRKALIQDGKVVNVILIEEGSSWKVPPGCQLLSEEKSLLASPGDTWDGEKFIKPEPVVVEPKRDLEKEIDELKSRLDKIDKA